MAKQMASFARHQCRVNLTLFLVHIVEINVMYSFLRSTSGATRCQPLDGKHCGVSTRFISCPGILLCGGDQWSNLDIMMMHDAWSSYVDTFKYLFIFKDREKKNKEISLVWNMGKSDVAFIANPAIAMATKTSFQNVMFSFRNFQESSNENIIVSPYCKASMDPNGRNAEYPLNKGKHHIKPCRYKQPEDSICDPDLSLVVPTSGVKLYM